MRKFRHFRLVNTPEVCEEQRKALINRGEFTPGHLAEDPTDSALVYRAKMINEGAGLLDQAARTRCESRIQRSRTTSPRDWNDGEQWEPLVRVHAGVADG